MTLLLIIFCIWGASALARATKEAARQKEIDRQRREQAARSAELARMTAEWKQRQAEAKIETARLIALEREQMRQAREQEKLAKEQEKQAEVLRKHEKRLADLEYRVSQAESAIYNEQIKLDHYAQKLSALDEEIAKIDRDIEYYQLANKVDAENKARAARVKVEDKIFSFEEKVRACEMRMDKAQHTKAMAQREMEVA